MRTKLDLIVDFLADRPDGSTEAIRRELMEPSSEATLFLEGLRERTRAMLEVVPSEFAKPKPIRPNIMIPPSLALTSKRWKPLPFLTVAAAAAATVLVAVTVAWRDQKAQLHRLEVANAQREREWQDRIRKLEQAQAESLAKEKAQKILAQTPPKPSPKPAAPDRQTPEPRERAPEILLARLEVGLARLEKRLSESAGPPPAPENPDTEPALDQLRGELEGFKRDASAREKAVSQDLKELKTTLREVIIWIRQISNMPGLQAPVQIPVPVPIPVPSGGGDQNGQGILNNPALSPLLPYLGQNPQQHQKQSSNSK